ncbi:MAG: hypothetical protein KDB23_28735, partial [Planctomycetales bacterium]|nr:hypothetical protein [Planctomycetales bacterium]
PNKEKYVIRRLLRRAVLDGHQMGQRDPFLYQLVPAVVDAMKGPYPELAETAERVASVIQQEEKTFLATIDEGLSRIERLFDDLSKSDRKIVDGESAADLYQTYGVPAELFESLAADRGFAFDWNSYREAMEAHGEKSGKLVHTVMGSTGPIDAIKKAVKETTFLGYDATQTKAEIKGIVVDDQLIEELTEIADGASAVIVLDQSPFYGESGGQVGDQGRLTGPTGGVEVVDTQRDGDLLLHHVTKLSGKLRVGDSVTAEVDESRRDAIRRAHSATHILHHALQKTLGKHAQQQGSKVTEDWLRFDFTNLEPVTTEQLETITTDVRKHVQENAPIKWETVPLETARAAGAMMLFGEKYPDPVRMVSMGGFSRELCGGTHLNATGQVLAFEIVSEEGVSAGTRRITALTGTKAQEYLNQCKQALNDIAKTLNVSVSATPDAAKHLLQEVRELKKALAGSGKPLEAAATAAKSAGKELGDAELKSTLRELARSLNVSLFDVPARVTALKADRDAIQKQLADRLQQDVVSADDLLSAADEYQGVKLVVAEVPSANGNLLRQMIDQIRQVAAPCAVFLGTVEDGAKVTLVAGVSRDVQGKLHAGNWVKAIAPHVGGGGGGKPDLAQAGGKEPSQLPEALKAASTYVREQLEKS